MKRSHFSIFVILLFCICSCETTEYDVQIEDKETIKKEDLRPTIDSLRPDPNSGTCHPFAESYTLSSDSTVLRLNHGDLAASFNLSAVYPLSKDSYIFPNNLNPQPDKNSEYQSIELFPERFAPFVPCDTICNWLHIQMPNDTTTILSVATGATEASALHIPMQVSFVQSQNAAEYADYIIVTRNSFNVYYLPKQ